MASAVIAALGKALTVKVAAPDSALPQALLKSARYRLPLSPELAVKLYVELVAPAMLVKVLPPSELICHWTPGAGLPLAAAVNETELPAHTTLLVGFAVTAAGVLTVTVALPEPEFEQRVSVTPVTE